MAAAEPALLVRGLSKRYQGVTAVEDISFQVAPGEILGMLGPNGAGKTTTLRMIVGLVRPTAGEVRILGHSVQRERELALAEVGTIIEEARFYRFLSGIENLRQASRLRGLPTDEDTILKALRTVELEEAARRPVRSYSLGMRQRLALALALLQNPRLLVLDEPMNGLDPAAIRDLRAHIRAMAAGGVSVILSSHLLSEVEQICDRVILIERGRLTGEEVLVGERRAQAVIRVSLRDGAERGEAALRAAGYAVREGEGVLLLPGRSEDDIPAIVRLLTREDLDLFGIEARQPTLEDRYLAMTGRLPSPDSDEEGQVGA